MAVISDDFNRADETTSATTSSGSAWTGVIGAALRIGVSSNKAYASTANGISVVPANGANGYGQVLIDTCPGNARLGIAFRCDGTSSNYWIAYRDNGAGNHLVLLKVVGGAGTVVNSSSTTVNAGDLLSVSWQASGVIKTWLNGTLIQNVTDTALQTNTRHGIYINETTGRLDNFYTRDADLAIGGPDTPSAAVAANAATVKVGPTPDRSGSGITAVAVANDSSSAPNFAITTVAVNAPYGGVGAAAQLIG